MGSSTILVLALLTFACTPGCAGFFVPEAAIAGGGADGPADGPGPFGGGPPGAGPIIEENDGPGGGADGLLLAY